MELLWNFRQHLVNLTLSVGWDFWQATNRQFLAIDVTLLMTSNRSRNFWQTINHNFCQQVTIDRQLLAVCGCRSTVSNFFWQGLKIFWWDLGFWRCLFFSMAIHYDNWEELWWCLKSKNFLAVFRQITPFFFLLRVKNIEKEFLRSML